jgi:hypothetical protein
LSAEGRGEYVILARYVYEEEMEGVVWGILREMSDSYYGEEGLRVCSNYHELRARLDHILLIDED